MTEPRTSNFADVLRVLERELSSCADRADRLQRLPGEWCANDQDRRFIAGAQDLDLLAQELRGLAQFCLGLSQLSGQGHDLNERAMATAGAELQVRRLACRLTNVRNDKPPDGGEVELW